MLRFCPNCGENLQQYQKPPETKPRQAVVMTQSSYNQTEIWKKLVEISNACAKDPPTPESLVLPVLQESAQVFANSGGPVRSVIHLVLDRSVTPQGGILRQATLVDGNEPPSVDQFDAAGYLIDDGKVVTADDVPVGHGYQVLEYWGGERQHKRWHLEKPISINPSRNGDPYFMDEGLVAFGAKWLDGERLEEALLTLMELFLDGINGAGRVGVPLALAIYWQNPTS